MRHFTLLGILLAGLLTSGVAFGQSRSEETVFQDTKSDPTRAVQLYPNPATDILTIRFEQPQARKIKLAMNTIIGNNLEVEAEVIDDFELHVKVRDLPPGYYLLAIHNSETNSQNTYKFLKR